MFDMVCLWKQKITSFATQKMWQELICNLRIVKKEVVKVRTLKASLIVPLALRGGGGG